SAIVERNLGSRGVAIRLVGGFGVLALALMAAGVYGIVAFRASGRSREMAIRVAVGATAGEVRRLILGDGLVLDAIGAGGGVIVFLLASPLIEAQLYGVKPADPVIIAVVIATVLVVSVAASLAPSRRAA